MALLALIATTPSRVAALEDVPAPQLAQLVLRILAYDRNLPKRAGSAVTIALIHRKNSPESESSHTELKEALEASVKKVTVAALPVRIASISFSTPEALDAQLGGVSVVFICAGLGDVAADISKVTRKRSVLSFAGQESYVDAGLSIALVRRGAKPAIVISLPATRAEGADLDAAVLRLAEVRH